MAATYTAASERTARKHLPGIWDSLVRITPHQIVRCNQHGKSDAEALQMLQEFQMGVALPMVKFGVSVSALG